MKLLLLTLFVACVTASFHDALDQAADEIYQDFLLGMEDAGSLKEALGLPQDHYYADHLESDAKEELAKKLRETLDKLVERIKEHIEKGKTVGEDLVNKLKELKEKMKDLHVDLGGKAKELMDKAREKAKQLLKDLMDRLGGKDSKRAVSEIDIEAAMLEFNFKEMFKNLKKFITDKIDKEALKAKIEEIFGKGNEMADSLLEFINKKGDHYKEKLHELIDRYLGKKDKRDIKDIWEKVKDYFKDFHIDLKEKYAKFGEWVKEVINKGLDKSKSKLENIKAIAKEFLEHTKGVSKDVAVEALDFLRPYKEDLGSLWDQLKETVKDIVNRKD